MHRRGEKGAKEPMSKIGAMSFRVSFERKPYDPTQEYLKGTSRRGGRFAAETDRKGARSIFSTWVPGPPAKRRATITGDWVRRALFELVCILGIVVMGNDIYNGRNKSELRPIFPVGVHKTRRHVRMYSAREFLRERSSTSRIASLRGLS
jgi:hypothetical protein